jgi:hypothetical protein
LVGLALGWKGIQPGEIVEGLGEEDAEGLDPAEVVDFVGVDVDGVPVVGVAVKFAHFAAALVLIPAPGGGLRVGGDDGLTR